MSDKRKANHLWLVVMAGGSGTRFWPRSRASLPKQLINIIGDESLLKTTVARFQDWVPEEQRLVVATEDLKDATKEALQGAQVELLCEPSGKNTAPCIVFAMEWIRARDPEATVMIVPADHWISEAAEYLKVMKHAVGAAEKSALLITVGIQPTRAESGYGYIRSGERLNDGVYKVDRFVEKPKREVAETMIQDPEYF